MSERPAPVPGVDPLFTDEDAIEILEYLADEHLVCSGCGQPLAESIDIDNSYAYRVDIFQCHGCAAVERATKNLDDRAGLRSRVMKRD